MLIINADDFGRDRFATDSILSCYSEKRITSASAMVFMEDSERAASLGGSLGMDIGLHINFTEQFTARSVPERLRQNHKRLRRFLRASKYALVIYHPFLRKAFRQVFEAQLLEFERLYGRVPARFDGHQHMHLCSNMILERLIPAGTRVRRSFTFAAGEKGVINRAYRSWIDRRLAARHSLTDYFFAVSSHLGSAKIFEIFNLSRSKTVELMTHTWNSAEYEWLMGNARNAINTPTISMGSL